MLTQKLTFPYALQRVAIEHTEARLRAPDAERTERCLNLKDSLRRLVIVTLECAQHLRLIRQVLYTDFQQVQRVFLHMLLHTLDVKTLTAVCKDVHSIVRKCCRGEPLCLHRFSNGSIDVVLLVLQEPQTCTPFGVGTVAQALCSTLVVLPAWLALQRLEHTVHVLRKPVHKARWIFAHAIVLMPPFPCARKHQARDEVFCSVLSRRNGAVNQLHRLHDATQTLLVIVHVVTGDSFRMMQTQSACPVHRTVDRLFATSSSRILPCARCARKLLSMPTSDA